MLRAGFLEPLRMPAQISGRLSVLQQQLFPKLFAVGMAVGGTNAGYIGDVSVAIFERAIVEVQADTLLRAVSG
jgi:hypothetical protein